MSEAASHENVMEIAAKKAPVGAIAFALIVGSLAFSVAYFLKETKLNEPLIDLIKAQTVTNTDLTKEVKSLTAVLKDAILEARRAEEKNEKKFDEQHKINVFVQKQIDNIGGVLNEHASKLPQNLPK